MEESVYKFNLVELAAIKECVVESINNIGASMFPQDQEVLKRVSNTREMLYKIVDKIDRILEENQVKEIAHD